MHVEGIHLDPLSGYHLFLVGHDDVGVGHRIGEDCLLEQPVEDVATYVLIAIVKKRSMLPHTSTNDRS